MAKPRGHVQLNGKDYLVQDSSYQSKMVPLFRPQLTIEGISHEALDQFLYWVQSTWNRVTHRVASRGVWRDGGYGAINGLDNSEDRKLRLQPSTSVALSVAAQGGILLPFGGFLYLFYVDGTVKRSSDGTTWNAVTFNFSADAGTTTAPGATSSPSEPNFPVDRGRNDPAPGSGSGSDLGEIGGAAGGEAR